MKKIILILFAAAVLLASVYADFPISNLIPSNNSVLPSGTTSTTLSVETNINASCRYWNTSGQDFSSMTLFTNTDELNHNSTITGLQDAQGYDYYVKCQNADNASDITDDSHIHFFILDYALEYCFTDQLGYWTFDNFIDNIIYDILGINYGTIYGDVTTNPSVVGDGFNFDGVDSYIDVSGDIDLADSTISFWITPDQDYGLGSGQTAPVVLFRDGLTDISIDIDGRIIKRYDGEIIAGSPPGRITKDKTRLILLDENNKVYWGNSYGCLVSEALGFSESNPEEVATDSSINMAIEIDNGCPPFEWTVSGEGFSLEEGIDGEVILSANGSACGSAEINVTDDLGQIVTQYVRSTVGQWILKGNYCGLAGATGDVSPSGYNLNIDATIGNKKQEMLYDYLGIYQYSSCLPGTYAEVCLGPSPCEGWISEACSAGSSCLDYTINCIFIFGTPSLTSCGKEGAICKNPCGCGWWGAEYCWWMDTHTYATPSGEDLRYYEWECAP